MPRFAVLKKFLFIALSAAFCVAADVHAQSDSVALTVNRLRAPGGACQATASPLIPQTSLDSAAARLAKGDTPEAALKYAGYRATQAQVLTVKGAGMRSGLQALLAKRFCAQIGETAVSDIGVFEGREQVWIVLAAPFAPRLELTPQQIGERMLALVNKARSVPRRCGDKSFAAAPALVWDTTLETVAAQHANDMATNDFFSHTARDGSTPAQRVTRAGYRWRMTGENIAAGQLSAEAAVAGWIKSPGHCENLMNAGFTAMGVAAAVNANSKMGLYWAQEFGTPR